MKRRRSTAAYNNAGFKRPRRITPAPMYKTPYSRPPGGRSFLRPGAPLEKKFIDVSSNLGAVSPAGTIDPAVGTFLAIAQGTTENDRIGNKINITNINVHFTVSMDDQGTGAMVNLNMRYILYIDKQCNGAAATPGLILAAIAGGVNIASFREMDNLERFIILKDKWIHFNVNSANALHTLQGSSRWYSCGKKVNIPVSYSGVTGVIAELRSYNICSLLISDVATMNYTALTRIKYTDA